MEVTFNVVNPNLYVVGDEVYFGINDSDLISVSKSVNEIVAKHIGNLNVREASFEAAEYGKSRGKQAYSIPLIKYLDAIERISKSNPGQWESVTNDSAQLFGLAFVIDAQTIESGQDLCNWIALRDDLADPNETFDRYEKNQVRVLDRERTLEEMKKLYGQLGLKMPDNCAKLVIVNGEVPYSRQTNQVKYLGMISFIQLKAKDISRIEEAKADLVERLKEVDGPSLSFDAPQLHRQIMELYVDAPKLIRRYGDVLLTRDWERRLFRLDP